jgi:cell division protein FtsN
VAVPDGEADYGDDGLYAEPPPRASRRSAADYQQAYRDMENVYEEDEAPRSRGPWILLALLLLALGVAFGAVWFYQSSVKPMMSPTQTSTEQVPVVPAPAGQAKVQPEQPAPEAGGQAPIGKKRIYDRIVGDQEVLGGAISPTEEVPLAPAEGSSQVPDPATPAGEGTGQGLGDDSAPLPIPPPPGDGNTQGALPNGSEKQSVALNNPAADDSSAAVAVSGADVVPPAPGETVEPASANSEQEVINDAPAPAPVVEPKPAKKPAVKKTASKSLGSKPVVLVAPKKKAVAPAPEDEVAETTATVDEIAASDSNGLYGDSEATAQTAQPTPQPAPVKKKKTLADLFNNSDDDATAPQFQEEAPPAPAPTPKVTKPKPVAPAPAETQVASASGYAAQLASFRTREEASSEFSRLKSKHASILSGLSPVISQAEVAGSTRYRLSVGGMGSRDQASALCAKLLAAGERDCLVKRQ